MASAAMSPVCASFDEPPSATLVFKASKDLREGPEPPPSAMLRLAWKALSRAQAKWMPREVHVASNGSLPPIRLHQVARGVPLGSIGSGH